VDAPTDSLANGAARAPAPAVSTLAIETAPDAPGVSGAQAELAGDTPEELLRCKRELEALLEALERDP
jgi:hypothetical protein